MIFPTPMKQLIAVVLEQDVDEVTRSLLDAGLMHFINIRNLVGGTDPESADMLNNLDEQSGQHLISEARRKIESILGLADINPGSSENLDIKMLSPVDLGQTQEIIDRIGAAIEQKRSRQNEIQQEILRMQDIGKQTALFGNMQEGIRAGSRFSYLSMQTGAVPAGADEAFEKDMKKYPSVVVPVEQSEDRTAYFVVTMKRDDKQINELLAAHDWQDMEIASHLENIGDDVQHNISEKIVRLQKEQIKLAGEMRETVTLQTDQLLDLWANLRMNELYAKLRSYFSKTSRTVLFSGWVPASKKEIIEKRINRACKKGCYLEWQKPSNSKDLESSVPVELKSPEFLSPFKMLVQNFAVPEYGTINPTPFVALSYLVMFGLMFGDAGQGMVLAIIGFLGMRFYQKRNNVRQIFTLLVWCGFAAIVAGILFGSYFGTQLFRPLWFDYHGIVSGHGGSVYVSSIYDVLAITLYFGISIISLGLLINWINLIAKKRWFELVFDKGGLLGGIIYGAGVWAAIFFVKHAYRELPDVKLLFLLLGLPVIALAFKAPIAYLRDREHRHAFSIFTLIDFGMEWIVEILEIFSGYLANTLSFMRVAGLGIAHESLMIGFFQIAGMVGGTGGFSIWSVLVLVLGNALVLALEGLGAGIQSLRLNYYEFFSKYFSGRGVTYSPISIRNKA